MMRRDQHSFDIRMLDDFPFGAAFSTHFRHFVLIFLGLLLATFYHSSLVKTLVLTCTSVFLFKVCRCITSYETPAPPAAAPAPAPAPGIRTHSRD